MTIDIPKGYEALGLALGQAVAQAARGKGSERHSYDGEAFSDQLIFEIPRRLGACGSGFLLGQAVKKIYESVRLEPERARAEILGAINYLATAWSRQGGFSDVFAPEPASPERLFRPGEDVEILDGGDWRPASYVRPEDDGTHTVLLGSSRLALPASGIRKAPPCAEDADAPRAKKELYCRIRDVNPAVYPQEDCEAPLFPERTPVECRPPLESEWTPAFYIGVDPAGYHIVERGGTRMHLSADAVRKPEES